MLFMNNTLFTHEYRFFMQNIFLCKTQRTKTYNIRTTIRKVKKCNKLSYTRHTVRSQTVFINSADSSVTIFRLPICALNFENIKYFLSPKGANPGAQMPILECYQIIY